MKSYNNIKYLLGNNKYKKIITKPYDSLTCEFISEFSLKLDKHNLIKNYPDLKTLAFWCRKKNIDYLKSRFITNEIRLGIGLLFHITPSNIPTNFAYSLIFGILTGNSNIIKVPSKKFSQVDIICNCLKSILKKKKFKSLINSITVVRYNNNDEFTKKISSICDGRIIWGGNKTIKEIRKFELQERSIDIAFSDRFSLSLINVKKISKMNEFDLHLLIQKFYNDTYLVDQNACSSPHLIIWNDNKFEKVKNKFWYKLNELTKKKYKPPLISSMDKVTKLHEDIIRLENFKKHYVISKNLYVITLKNLDKEICKLRGKWGYFYEYSTKNIDKCFNILNKNCQTLSYYGFSKKFLRNLIVKNKVEGIDRIVPIGQALDIGLYWDGYDLNKILSRVIDLK